VKIWTRFCLIAQALLLFIFGGINCQAQISENSSIKDKDTNLTVKQNSTRENRNEFILWGGFAPDSPKLIGSSKDSYLTMAGIRYMRRIATSKNLALKFTAELTPLILLSYQREILQQVSPGVFRTQTNRTTAYGFGGSPLGLQLNFRRQKKLQPYLTLSGGLVMFNKTVPDNRSTLQPNNFGKKFNYMIDGGGGIQYKFKSGRSMMVGYKFHHISNAYTGNINPGFDSNFIYVGYSFIR
jgi:hypothetical protein